MGVEAKKKKGSPMSDSIIMERVADAAADCLYGELIKTEDFEAFELLGIPPRARLSACAFLWVASHAAELSYRKTAAEFAALMHDASPGISQSRVDSQYDTLGFHAHHTRTFVW